MLNFSHQKEFRRHPSQCRLPWDHGIRRILSGLKHSRTSLLRCGVLLVILMFVSRQVHSARPLLHQFVNASFSHANQGAGRQLTDMSGGSVTHGSCVTCGGGAPVTLPSPVDSCPTTFGCLPLTPSDCFNGNSAWPWFFGGKDLKGATTVTAMDSSTAQGGTFIVGGYTSDTQICTFSQVYLAAISQATGTTLWVRSLNTQIKSVLAIRFFETTTQDEAVVAVLHPSSMFLISAKIDGTLTSLARLTSWYYPPNPVIYPNFWRDITTNVGLETDSNFNVYIATYSEKKPLHQMYVQKMAPKKTTLDQIRIWSTSTVSTEYGKAKVLKLDPLKTKLYAGGSVANLAYLHCIGTSMPTRQWYLQSISQTSKSEVVLLASFKDPSEAYNRLSAVIIETENTSQAKALIFLNILLTSNSGPFTPSYVKLAGNLQPVAYIGINGSQTVAFAQNLDSPTTNVLQMIFINWSSGQAKIKSFDYGPAYIFVLTHALLFQNSLGDPLVYFTGYSNTIWGSGSCNSVTSFHQMYMGSPNYPGSTFGIVNTIGPNQQTCVRPLTSETTQTLDSVSNYMTVGSGFTYEINSSLCSGEWGSSVNKSTSCSPLSLLADDFCKAVSSQCSSQTTPPVIQSQPISDQTWIQGGNLFIDFTYWSYTGTSCTTSCSGTSLVYKLTVVVNGVTLEEGNHPFFISGSGIYGDSSFSQLAQTYTLTLTGSLQDISACSSVTFNVNLANNNCVMTTPFDLVTDYSYAPSQAPLQIPFPTLIKSNCPNGETYEVFFMFEAGSSGQFPVLNLQSSPTYWTFFTDLNDWNNQMLFLRMVITPLGSGTPVEVFYSVYIDVCKFAYCQSVMTLNTIEVNEHSTPQTFSLFSSQVEGCFMNFSLQTGSGGNFDSGLISNFDNWTGEFTVEITGSYNTYAGNTFPMKLTCDNPLDSSAPVVTTFSIVVDNPTPVCTNYAWTVSSLNLDYTVNSGPKVEDLFAKLNLPPTSQCPVLIQIDPQNSLFVVNNVQGNLTIQSNNRALDSQVFTMNLIVTSQASGFISSIPLTVTFWSDCRNNVILQAPQFSQSLYTPNLYQSTQMPFTWPTFSIPSCAGYFTSMLVNAATGQQTNLFTFVTNPTSPFYTAVPNAKNPWVTSSPWQLRVTMQDGFGHSTSSSVIQLKVIDVCLTATFASQTIPTIQFQYGSSTASQYTFNFFLDSVSQTYSVQYGDGSNHDLCGPQSYKLVNLANNQNCPCSFASLTGSQSITVSTNQQADVGVHNMMLVTTLINYPTVSISTPVTIDILQCQLTFLQFQTPSSTNLHYNIDSSSTPASYQIPQILKSPAECDAPLAITLIDANTMAEIPWIMLYQNNIMIATDDPSKAGEYQLTLTVTATDQSPLLASSIDYTLTLSPCLLDQVSLDQAGHDYEYRIGEFLDMQVSFSSLYLFECPLQYVFTVDGSTDFDQDVFTVGFGSWMMFSNDPSIVGNVYKISITAYSGTPGPNVPKASTQFDIVVRPSQECENPVIGVQSPLQISFWQSFMIPFQSPQAGPECGEISYRLLDEFSHLEIPQTEMWIEQSNPYSPSINALIRPTSSVVGQSHFKVLIELNQGNMVIHSDPIDVIFVDPCASTILQSQTILPMSAVDGQTQLVIKTFNTFKDSVSLQYSSQFGNGSGSDLCGPQAYNVFEVINGDKVPVDFVYLTTGQRVINLDASSHPTLGQHQLLLEVHLQNYSITHEEPFTVTIDACQVTGISVGTPTQSVYQYDVSVVPSNTLEILIPPVSLQPTQCPFGIFLSVQFQSNGQPVPFATVNPNNQGFKITLSDGTYSGTQNIWAVIIPSGPNTVQPIKIPYTIKITTCGLHDFSSVYPFSDTTYTLGSVLTFSPDVAWWNPSMCTLTYAALINSQTTFDPQFFTYSQATGTLTVFNNNPINNGKKFTVAMSVQDTHGHQYQKVFILTITDPCSGNQITQLPAFTTPMQHSVFSTDTVVIVDIQRSIQCGQVKTSFTVPTASSAISPYLTLVTNTNGKQQINVHVTQKSLLTTNGAAFDVNVTIKIINENFPTFVYDSKTFTIKINLVDPCHLTVIQSQNLAFAQTSVKRGSAAISAAFNSYLDSVSLQYSDGFGDGSDSDICAPWSYSVYQVDPLTDAPLDSSSYLYLQGLQIIFNPVQTLNYGVHKFVLKVQLPSFNKSHEDVLTIEVTQCELTSLLLVSPSQTSYTYAIDDPATLLQIPMPTVLVEPSDCDQGLNYQLLDDETGLPLPFVATDYPFTSIDVQTSNPEKAGTYQLRLVVSVAGEGSTTPQQTLFELNLDPCMLSTVSASQTISDFSYVINSGPLNLQATFASLYSSFCSLQYTFKRKDMLSYDANIFTFTQETGHIVVQSANRALGGTQMTMQLTATPSGAFVSPYSATVEFTVTFVDDCSLATISSAAQLNPVAFTYYAITGNLFAPATTSDATCGAFVYSLIDADTGEAVPETLIWIDSTTPENPQVKGLVLPSSVNPPNAVKIVVHQGSYTAQIVQSGPIPVTYVDPCLTTIIAPQSLTPMSGLENDPPKQASFNIFKDSVSMQYSAQFGNGSGSDLCGPQSYQVFEVINDQQGPSSYVFLTSPRQINLNPLLVPQGSAIGNHQFVLITTLDNYGITHTENFNVNISPCAITGISAGQAYISEYAYYVDVQNPGSVTAYLPSITLLPSNCISDIQISVIFQTDGSTVPFATPLTNKTGFTISTSSLTYQGSYDVWAVVVPSAPNSLAPLKIPYKITIDICSADVVSASSLDLPQLNYIVGTNGSVQLVPLFQHTVSVCAMTYQVTGINNLAVTFSASTNTLSVYTSDVNLNGTIMNLNLIATSQQSGSQAIRPFMIKFIDPCVTATIGTWTPFTQTMPLQASVYSLFNKSFSPAMPSSNTCGTIQYSVSAGSVQYAPILASILVSGTSLVGTLTQRGLVYNVPNGTYNLKIQAKLVGPTNVVYNSQEVSFSIKAADPCLFTVIEPQPLIYPSSVNQGSVPVSISFNAFLDTVSQQFSSQYGDGSLSDICSPQIYSVYEVTQQGNTVVPYLTFAPNNPRVIVFDPNNSVFIGAHQFQLKVSLYGGIVRYESFTINVLACQLTDFTLGPLQASAFTYQITQPLQVMTIPLPSVNRVPTTCNQALVWTVTDANTGNGYSFIQVQSGSIVVSSNNSADKGNYNLVLTVKTDGPSSALSKTIPFMMFMSPCQMDSITVTTTINSFNYVVNSGSVTHTATFTNLFPILCPMQYSLIETTSQEFASLISYNGITSVTVNLTDRTLNGTLRTLQMTAKNEFNTSVIQFTVKIVDDCTLVSLTKPTVPTTFPVQYYATSNLAFLTAGTTSKPSCGPLAYEVVDAFTLQVVSSALMWVDASGSMPTLNAKIKPGDTYPASVKIRFVQGPDVAGVTNSNTTSNIQIQLSDPCLTTSITSQLISAMAATTNQQTPTIQSFQAFKDTVSTLYGNGSGNDLCGPQTYQLYEIVNNTPQVKNFVYISTNPLRIEVDPLKSDSSIGLHSMRLVTTLTNYGITHSENFNVVIDQCQITSMTVGQPTITTYNYEILLNPQSLVIELPPISMTPTNCLPGIFIGVTDTNNNVPSFLTVSQNPTPRLIILTSDTSLVGQHSLNVMIKPAGPTTVNPVTLLYIINIGRCNVNQITVINNLDQVNYSFGQGPLHLNVFSVQFPDCPVAFSALINGSPVFNTQLFQVSQANGSLVIDSSSGMPTVFVYTIDLTATSILGTVTESFIVNFINVCDSAQVTQGYPWQSQTQPDFGLYQPFTYNLKPAVWTGAEQCGPPLYKILDSVTMIEVPQSLLSITGAATGNPVLHGLYKTREMSKWNATLQRYIYNYKLKVYIGDPNPTSVLLVDFTISLTEPCFLTAVDSQPISSQEIIIGGTNLNIPFVTFTDSVSFLYGTGSGDDICVPQTYAIKQLSGQSWIKPNWANVVGNQIQIDNSLISQNGVATYSMRLAVTPLFGPAHFEFFSLSVINCKIDSLTVANPNPLVYNYNIDNPATSLEVPLPFISVNPTTCFNGFLGNGLDYKLQVTGSNIQPPFFTKGTQSFTLSTSDPSKKGQWLIDLVIYPNASSSGAQPITKTYTFNLSACNLSNPAFLQTNTNTQYNIGSGPYLFNPLFTSLYPVDCPYTLTLTQATFPATTWNQAIVPSFLASTGVMTISSNDLSLIGTSIVYTIKANHGPSGKSVTLQVTVSFKDKCEGLTLTKPVWQDTNDSYYLWEDGKLFFNLATADKTNCNGATFSYKLLHAQTLQEIDPSVYVIQAGATVPYVRATPPSRNPWLVNQPWYFILKATFGQYGSVNSDPVKVPILDTCFKTTIVPQTLLQIISQADIGQQKIRLFDSFFDTVSQLHSAQFGNGSLYDLCGYTQVYSIFEVDGNNVKQPTNLATLPAGEKKIVVRPTTDSDVGFHNMVLKVSLPDFNVNYFQPFVILVGDCMVTAMSIQMPASTVINYEISQPGIIKFVPYPGVSVAPANCQVGFLYNIFEIGTTTQPSFVTLGASGFQILTSNLSLPDIQAQYKLELRITPDGPNSVGWQYIVYTVNFKRCHSDIVSIQTPIQDFNYYISQGPVTKHGSFTHLYAECPLTISLNEQTNTGLSMSMFTLNPATKSFTLDTSDPLLDLKSAKMMFSATQADSQSTVTHYFKISFFNQCYSATIQPGQFFQQAISIELYSQQVVYFTMPTASNPNCGALSLSLVDSQTGEILPTNIFALDLMNPQSPKITVLFTSAQWLQKSPVSVAVQAKLGNFASIISQPILISVIDPCLSTVLETQTIVNMATSLNALAPASQQYQIFKDSVSQAHSQAYGNGLGFGMCGSQQVKLFKLNSSTNLYESTTVASINLTNRTIVAGVYTDISLQGEHKLMLRVALISYPNIFLELPFTLTISQCTTTSMTVTPPAITSYTYDIMNGSIMNLVMPYPTVAFAPSSCGTSAAYTLSVQGSTTIPSFITLSPAGIAVSTNNPSFSGISMVIHLTVNPNGPNTVSPKTIDYTLKITACKIDEVTASQLIPDYTYLINSGELIVPSYFSSTYHCPLTYTLTTNIPSGTPVTTILNESNGSVKIIGSDLSLNGKQFTFEIKATSITSQDFVIDSFKVTFKEVCSTVQLTAPVLAQTFAVQAVYSEANYYFQPAIASTQGCGNITYRVLEAASYMVADTNSFTIYPAAAVPNFKFRIASRSPWINLTPFQIVIEAKLGSFKTVYSSPMTIQITDPCISTTIVSQYIQQMTTSKMSTTTQQQVLSNFLNSVSQQYSSTFGNGNGYDLCGPMTYTLQKVEDNSSPAYILVYFATGTGHPVIKLDPQLLPPDANGPIQFRLRVVLTDYSISHDEFFYVFVSDCIITGFEVTAAQIRDYTYDIGQAAIQVPYPQVTFTPDFCIYPIEYSVTNLGTNNVPTFITLGTGYFTIYTNNPAKIGDHVIELKLTPHGPNQVGPRTVTYTIEITGCSLNNIQKKLDLPDYTYLIGSAALAINGQFDADYPACEIVYNLQVETAGVYNPSAITFNPSSPVVSVYYTYSDMQGTTLKLTLTATSVVSQHTATQVFDVTFLSGCENLQLLSAPLVMQSTIQYTLWQQISVSIQPPVLSEPISKCGPPQYQVVIAGTYDAAFANELSVNTSGITPKIEGVFKNKLDLANFPIDLQVLATYGSDKKPSNNFKLTITDPCKNAALVTHLLANMMTTVLRGTPEIQVIQPFLDSVSTQFAAFGNGTGYDLCGAQSYQLFELINGNPVAANFAQIADNNKISVETADPATIGTHSMRLVVALNDYPNVKLNRDFTVTINGCIVLSLTPNGTIPDTNYKLATPQLAIQVPDFVKSPPCQRPITYQMTANGGILPSFIQFDQSVSPMQVKVQTNNASNIGDYNMVLTAKVINSSTQTVQATSVVAFVIHVLNGDAYCVNDTVQLVSAPNPSSYTYQLGSSAVVIAGIFNHSEQYCEIVYSLTQTGYSQGLFDPGLFTFNSATGQVSVFANASQTQYDNLTTTLTVRAKSSVSLSTAQWSVNVTVKHKCRLANYTGPSLNQTTFFFDYRDENIQLMFKPVNASSTDCATGPFTYNLQVTNQQGTPSAFNVGVEMPNKINIDTNAPTQFDLTITATGPYLTSPLVSPLYHIVLQNRCNVTALLLPNPIPTIVTSELGSPVAQAFQLPSVQLATDLGITDACGKIQPDLKVLGTNTTYPWFSLQADTLTILVSNTVRGDAGTYQLQLNFQLKDYSSVTASQTITVVIQGCLMTQFSIANTFYEVFYNLGALLDQQNLEPFTTEPKCNYKIDYSARLVSGSNTLTSLPPSMQFLNGEVFQVETSDSNQLGDYTVQVTGQVTEGPQKGMSANFRFVVHILPFQSNADQVNHAPYFLTDLAPGVSTVAETGSFDLGLTMPQTYDPDGDNVDMEFDFAQLQNYLEYESSTRKVVLKSQYRPEQVPLGFFIITITLTDDSPLGPLSTTYQVTIDINPPQPDDTQEQTEYNFEPPSIYDISNTGLVTLLFNDPKELQQLLQLQEQITALRRLRSMLASDDLNLPIEHILQIQDEATQTERHLQSTQALFNLDVQPFQVEMIPSTETNPKRLNYDWKIVGHNKANGMLDVQMTFTDPEYISSNIDYDKVQFKLVDPKFYSDPNGRLEDAIRTVKGDIIRQIDENSDSAQRIKTCVATVRYISLIIIAAVFCLFLTQKSADDPYLWSFLDTMQLLTHLQLINIKLPSNAAIFMNWISPIFRFDFIKGDFLNRMYHLKYRPSPLTVFQQVGYTQVYMLTNTFTIGVIFGFLIVAWALFFAIQYLVNRLKKPVPEGAEAQAQSKPAVVIDRKSGKKYKHVQGRLRHQLFVGMPVRLILLLYQVICVTSIHNLLGLGADFSSVVAFLSIMVLFACIAYVTNKYFKFLRQSAKNKKASFGWLAGILHLRRGQSRALVYPILFLGRRFILSFVFVFLYELYAAQVVIWQILSIITMFTISRNKPFQGKWLNRVTFVNEVFLFVGGTMLLPLANIMEDLDKRRNVGIFIIVWVILCIAFNIIILLLRSLFILINLCVQTKKNVEEWLQNRSKAGGPEEIEMPDFNPRSDNQNPLKKEIELLEEQLDSDSMPEVLETERPLVEPAERTEIRNPSDDLEYDAEPEYRIRKKPKSFIQAPRGKGVSVATSMTDLKNNNEDQDHRHKHYHTVIERTVYIEKTNQNQRDDKGVQNFGEEDKIDLRSRKARMEIIGEHAASFKVEIQPIDGDKDNYYIMTTDGAPFAKILQNYDSGLSIESENLRFDDQPNNSNLYRGRDTIMSDLVNQNHNTTQIRLDDDSLPAQLNQPDENSVDEISVDSVNKGSSFVSNPVSLTSRPSILKQVSKYQPPNELREQPFVHNILQFLTREESGSGKSAAYADVMVFDKPDPEVERLDVQSSKVKESQQSVNLHELLLSDLSVYGEDQPRSSNEIVIERSKPQQKAQIAQTVRQSSKSSESIDQTEESLQTNSLDYDDAVEEYDDKNRIVEQRQKIVKMVSHSNLPGKTIQEKELIIKHIYHEHEQDPDHHCPYCDAAPVEKPKIDDQGADPTMQMPDSSVNDSSEFGSEYNSVPYFQNKSVFRAEGIIGKFELNAGPEDDGIPIIQDIVFNNPTKRDTGGKSMISNTSNIPRQKITVDCTGVPIISKPLQVTLLGDVSDEVKSPLDNSKPSFILQNKWLEAQRAASPFNNQVVNESADASEHDDKFSSSQASLPQQPLEDEEEESKGYPDYPNESPSGQSDMLRAPVDSSLEIRRPEFGGAFGDARGNFVRQSNPVEVERVRNSLAESESVATSDVEVRMRKLQKQIDLKHEFLPEERKFKLEGKGQIDSDHQFDLSMSSSIDYMREVKEINRDVDTDSQK